MAAGRCAFHVFASAAAALAASPLMMMQPFAAGPGAKPSRSDVLAMKS